MLDRIRDIYFSSHHFTRDLIGTVAPLTAFALIAVAAYDGPRNTAVMIFREYIVDLTFWALLFALSIYLLGGYFVGTMVAFAGNLLHRIVQRLPRVGKPYSYTYWYNKDAADIDRFYQNHITQEYMLSGAAVTPTDKINILKLYFRRYNPTGYAEAYRQFMKVDIARASLFYALVVLLYEAHKPLRDVPIDWIVVVAAALIIALALIELPRRIRKVVRTEYQFLIATARIVGDLERERGDT